MSPDPTLRQLARGGSRWAQAGFVLLVVGLIVVVATATVLRPGKPKGGAVTVRSAESAPPFRMQYARGELRVVKQTPTLVEFADAGDDRQASRLLVTPLRLPAYEGSPTGALPLASRRIKATVTSRFDDRSIRFIDEGFVFVGSSPAYQLTYVARRAGITWFGRAVVAVPDQDGARAAVLMDAHEQPGRQITSPRLVGREGDLRIPMRSLEFIG